MFAYYAVILPHKLIGTNGSSVAFQKQEIATLDKFYLSHPIFEIKR